MAKGSCLINTVLRGLALILLLGAAFDVWPWKDNIVIFAAIVLFIVTGMVSAMGKSGKGGGCCH